VKNLENVQGDERDIIIMSVCYGHDRNRRMLMNFGPINQRGGEKRLNVIFSRARRHMAVVSSIRHFDITNDYNDGASCLRNFLEYSAACSGGDASTARRVLAGANPLGSARHTANATDPVATQLAAALREKGLHVECDVGQSTFRLPLAVRRRANDAHTLGILIDDAVHFAQRDLLERYLLRPGVLVAFGWRVVQVFTKDWHHDPELVLRQIHDALEGVAVEPIEAEPAPEQSESRPASSRGITADETVAIEEIGDTGGPDENAEPIAKSRPAPVRTLVTSVTPSEPSVPRHFTCSEEGSSKFWEVVVDGNQLTIRFGRIGTNGQTQTKTFTTPEAAGREQEKLIRSKLAKGYIETEK
jgi:predicted DNA-binding WGR domain protein